MTGNMLAGAAMSRPRLFSWNPDTLKKTIIHTTDTLRGDVVIEQRQDCEPIIEDVKRLRDRPQTGDWKHVARIPLLIYFQAQREQWDQARWNRWLNDSDNRAFRVWTGRV